MKKTLQIILVNVLALFTFIANAQLPNGSIAPDFTKTDVDGNSINLYNIINQDKAVVVDISAHWCGPCWNYHNTGALEGIWNSYGPSGTNDMYVIWADGDPTVTLSELQGGGDSQGDWLTGTDFPMIGPNKLGNEVGQLFQVTNSTMSFYSFPTIFMVCPDKRTYEVGQLNTSSLRSWFTNNCAHKVGTNNAALSEPLGLKKGFCIGTPITPQIEIQNLGSAALTSCDITLTINGNTVETKNWTGNLAPYGFETISFNPVSPSGTSNFDFSVNNPNGSTDDATSNNSKSIAYTQSVSTTTTLLLTVKTDNYPDEIHWNIKNSSGAIVPGTSEPASLSSSTTYNYTYTVPANDCYTFNVTDDYGDGILSGQMWLRDNTGATVFNKASYGSGASTFFQNGFTSINEKNVVINSINLYPNPSSKSATVFFSLAENADVKISIVNILGEVLSVNNLGNVASGINQFELNTSGYLPGVYFVKLEAGKSVLNTKLMIQ